MIKPKGYIQAPIITCVIYTSVTSGYLGHILGALSVTLPIQTFAAFLNGSLVYFIFNKSIRYSMWRGRIKLK